MNHTHIVFTGSTALLGEEVICLIAGSYVLWTERERQREAERDGTIAEFGNVSCNVELEMESEERLFEQV